MLGRTDTEQYTRACEKIQNFIPQMTGGAVYRGGTKIVPITDATGQTALNTEVSSVIPDMKLVPYTPYNSSFNKILCITGTNDWRILPNGTEPTYGTQTALESLLTWTPSQTSYVQVGDLTILCDGNGALPPKVFYYDTGSAQYRVYNIDRDYVTFRPWRTIPWGPVNSNSSNLSLNPSATTGTITLTASAGIFNSSWIGTYFRLCQGTSLDGVVRITAVGGPTSATALVVQTLPAAGIDYGSAAASTTFWQTSIWSNFYGWPRTVTAFQGRVVFGGYNFFTDTIWGSRIGNIFDFEEIPSPNTTGTFGFASGAYLNDNSRPFALTPSTPEASNIYALSSSKTLVINTNKSDIVAYGSNGALGPNNVVFESSTSFGAEQVQPVRLNNYLTFVQRGGRKIRDIIFNDTEAQFKSTDLAFVAEHYTVRDSDDFRDLDPYKELAKTEDLNSILWCRTLTGRVYGVTLDRDYQINAWFRLELGQDSNYEPVFYDGGYTPIISICNFPESTNNYSALYMLVIRRANGANYASLEVLQPPWELGNTFDTDFDVNAVPPITERYPIYLDCAQVINKPGATATTTFNTTLTNINPYRDTKVHVYADGNYKGEFLVADDANGTLTLPDPANTIIVGYRYDGIIKTVPIEQGGQIGVPQGRIKRIDEMVLKFVNTVGCKFGPSETELEEIPFLEPDQDLDQGIRHFTGEKIVNFNGDYDRTAQVVIKQDQPYPCHVLCVIPRGITNE
jgi:hypothetical protein